MQLSKEQIEAYDRDGFLVVENVLPPADVAELRRVTEDFVERSRTITEHNDVYDLEAGHSADDPRVRRIKDPKLQHPVYDGIMRHPNILAILQQLVSPAIRFYGSKLNMKAPNYGAAVEWHQDWAFYPHTNDDLCAVGVMMDDCEVENGPLLCIPGSHKGPVFDHHSNGRFCGAIDPETADIDLASAVACTGKAGSISIHHVRTMHGSAVNTSTKWRRLLLYMYNAADAWPLATQPKDFETWSANLVCGDNDPKVPRVEPVPVRLPFPKPLTAGSIYEIQRNAGKTYFGRKEEAAAAM